MFGSWEKIIVVFVENERKGKSIRGKYMLKDSDPEKWEYREHMRIKHILLEKYLTAWIPILGKWNSRICYFDAFAGRGEYTRRDEYSDSALGSPVIALKLADQLEKYFGEFICILVEKDEDNFENLEKVLEREKANIENWNKIKVIKENGEFADVVDGIFKDLEKEKNMLAPSFFFVDPFGFSGIPFKVVERILANPKTEVFFNFMVRDISRFLEHSKLTDVFTELFGTEEWKDLVGLPDREKALIELYRKRLHEVVGVKYSWHFRVCESKSTRTLYYLIHATNNSKGHSIMKGIMYNQSALGSFAYLGPEDIAQRSQMQLFDVHDTEELERYLLNRFAGKTLTYEEIQEKVCMPWYSEPPYIDKHYRKELKNLERLGKIKVQRVTSKTPRGLSGQDKIHFL
ncbi:MAG: three-Cys-motif partner protein TcmP [Planctomycetota bacterium]